MPSGVVHIRMRCVDLRRSSQRGQWLRVTLVGGAVALSFLVPVTDRTAPAHAAVAGWTCDSDCHQTLTSDTTLGVFDDNVTEVTFSAAGGSGGYGGHGGSGGDPAYVSATQPNDDRWVVTVGRRGGDGGANGAAGVGANGAGNGGSSSTGGGGGGGGGGATTIRKYTQSQPFLVAAGGGGGGGGGTSYGAFGATGTSSSDNHAAAVSGGNGSCGGGGHPGQGTAVGVWGGNGGLGAGGAGGGGGGATTAGTGGYSCSGGAGSGGAFIGGVGGSSTCGAFGCLVGVAGAGGGGGGGSGVQGGGGGGAGSTVASGTSDAAGGGGAGSSRGNPASPQPPSTVDVSFKIHSSVAVAISNPQPLVGEPITMTLSVSPATDGYAGAPAGSLSLTDTAAGTMPCGEPVVNAAASCTRYLTASTGPLVGSFFPANAYTRADVAVPAITVRAAPGDGDFIRDPANGAIFRVVGGSPVYVPYCYDDACSAYTSVNRTSIQWLLSTHPKPAVGARMRSVETGVLYQISSDGVPVPVGNCSAQSNCPNWYDAAQSAIDALSNGVAPTVLGVKIVRHKHSLRRGAAASQPSAPLPRTGTPASRIAAVGLATLLVGLVMTAIAAIETAPWRRARRNPL